MFDLSTLTKKKVRTEIVTGKIISPTKVQTMSGETLRFIGRITFSDIGLYAKLARTAEGLVLLNTVSRDPDEVRTYIV